MAYEGRHTQPELPQWAVHRGPVLGHHPYCFTFDHRCYCWSAVPYSLAPSMERFDFKMSAEEVIRSYSLPRNVYYNALPVGVMNRSTANVPNIHNSQWMQQATSPSAPSAPPGNKGVEVMSGSLSPYTQQSQSMPTMTSGPTVQPPTHIGGTVMNSTVRGNQIISSVPPGNLGIEAARNIAHTSHQNVRTVQRSSYPSTGTCQAAEKIPHESSTKGSINNFHPSIKVPTQTVVKELQPTKTVPLKTTLTDPQYITVQQDGQDLQSSNKVPAHATVLCPLSTKNVPLQTIGEEHPATKKDPASLKALQTTKV